MRNLFIFPERLQASSRTPEKWKSIRVKSGFRLFIDFAGTLPLWEGRAARGNTKSIPFSPQNKRYPDGPENDKTGLSLLRPYFFIRTTT